jgi:hypothetical protein
VKGSVQQSFRPWIVQLILDKKTEKAIELLAQNYHVHTPKLKVGLPKGHGRNAYGTYSPKNETISVRDSEILGNPFVILHEFYHHLRCRNVDKIHRGTEKNADLFALDFLREYKAAATNPRLIPNSVKTDQTPANS